jgi:hypothetical protein
MELENEHRYYLERPQPLTVVHGDQLWSRGGDDGEGDPTHKVKGEPTLEVSTGDCCRVHDHQVGAAWSGLETGAKVDQDVEQIGRSLSKRIEIVLSNCLFNNQCRERAFSAQLFRERTPIFWILRACVAYGAFVSLQGKVSPLDGAFVSLHRHWGQLE